MSAPRRALIVIDVQNDYFDGPLAIQYPSREESERKIAQAIDAATRSGLPVAAIQHQFPAGAPVFAEGTEGWRLRPVIEERAQTAWQCGVKSVASVLADPEILAWLRSRDVDTITLVGYMTNNCVIGTAAAAEPLGFDVEVLSDATGAIHLANSAGQASAQQVHETLMVLLNSNFAAVAVTEEWESALSAGEKLSRSDLGSSAMGGAAAFGAI